jgi:hypothetical protein
MDRDPAGVLAPAADRTWHAGCACRAPFGTSSKPSAIRSAADRPEPANLRPATGHSSMTRSHADSAGRELQPVNHRSFVTFRYRHHPAAQSQRDPSEVTEAESGSRRRGAREIAGKGPGSRMPRSGKPPAWQDWLVPTRHRAAARRLAPSLAPKRQKGSRHSHTDLRPE